MTAIFRLLGKLSLLFNRRRFRSELDEEMAFHRAQVERDLVRDGMTPEAARRSAAVRFGNPARLREQSQEAVVFRAETILQDLRFALRQLRHNPGFALTAILILALGMGVSVAIFGFVDAALVQPLPYRAPDRLMFVDERSALFPLANLSRDDYEDWKRLNHTFSSLQVYTGIGFLAQTPSGTEPVPGRRVSAGFFEALGIHMMLGRGFLPGEDRPGGPKRVILTYGTWLKRFGGRRDIVGQSATLSGDNYTIVGVLPRDFEFAPGRDSEFWVPLLNKNGCEQRRSCHDLDGIGRLHDGVTMKQAEADLSGIAAQLERQYPDSNRGQGASVIPLSEHIIGSVRPVLLTLLGAAALLLAIACVNVASLMLVRSESRRREMAVRGALGATPARITRQFVTEGLVLSVAASGAGFLAAYWIMRVLQRAIPTKMTVHLPFIEDVRMNAHTGAVAAAIALLATVLVAATPALRLSFQPIREGLSEGGRTAAGRFWKRVGANFVVVELVIAVVLLVGAGLLGKSLYRLFHVDTGFDVSHLATAQVIAPDNLYSTPEKKLALFRQIEQRLSVLPGVQSTGITSDLPLDCNCNTDWIRVVGKPYNGEHNEVNEREISPAYLSTLKARLIRGRFITEEDDASKPKVILINEVLARKYFPGEDPVGQKIGNDALDPKSIREIVGVVGDIREGKLDNELWPAEYEPIYQDPSTSYFAVVVRTAQDAKSIEPALASTLHRVDPNLGVYGEITMQQQMDSSEPALIHRFSTWLVGGFAAMALVLSVVGLYGVIAYSVSQRTREIGVRMALGAQRGTVYGMVMRQAGWLTAVGIGLGLACAIGAAVLMRNLLFGVAAWDVSTLACVAAVLGMASLLASFLPARRAASVNPCDALRAE
jgi:macrolide transport system ATP-binding/permease protein